MVAAGSGIITGIILDMYGPGVTVIMCGVFMVGGCFTFGFGYSYIFGFAMFALGGMAVLISAFRVAYVFPDKASFVIGGVSCLFDSSTIVFVIFETLSSSLGWTMKTLFTIYAIMVGVSFTTTAILWFLNPEFNKSAKAQEAEESQALLAAPADPPVNMSNSINGSSPEKLPAPAALEQAMARGFKRNGSFDDVTPAPAAHANSNKDFDAAVATTSPAAAYVRVADRPFKEQLKSPEFIYLFVFTIVHMVRRRASLATWFSGNMREVWVGVVS